MSSTSSAIIRYPRCSFCGARSTEAPSYEISSTTVPPRSKYTRSIGTPRLELSIRSRDFNVQPELGRAHHVGHVPPDQTAATDLATKAVSSLLGIPSSRSAVNHLLKSVVREICTLRSVGTGGGRPPPVTRWVPTNGHPYRNLQGAFREAGRS